MLGRMDRTSFTLRTRGHEMDIRSTLRELCAAFNGHDLDRIMAFFTDDCVLEMPRGIPSLLTDLRRPHS